MTRLMAVFLISLAIAILFIRLGRSALFFDEAIYAQVSKEMVERHDWLTPHWNGQLWFHKPPLFFWTTAFLFKLFGVAELYARFASALSGLGVLLLSYAIGRRVYGSTLAGLLAVLILLSGQLFVFYARFGTTDTMLTFFILLSIYAYLKTEEDARFWLLAGAACAMALMVKGAAGVAAPAVLLLAAIVERNLVPSLRDKWLWLGVAVGLLIVLPWHLFMYKQHGQDFVNGYLFANVINRAKTNINEYQRGYGYYFSVLRDFFSPWVYILPAALLGRGRRTAVVVILGLTVFVLYTIAQTKFQWYILPAIPAFAIVISGGLARFMENRTRLQIRVGAVALILLWIFATNGVLRRIRTVDADVEAAARLSKFAARDRGGLMTYPEHLEMTVLFYSNRKLCTDPVISKLSHDVTTACTPSELTHIIVAKSEWDKIEGSFTITPLNEDGPLTYAAISRR